MGWEVQYGPALRSGQTRWNVHDLTAERGAARHCRLVRVESVGGAEQVVSDHRADRHALLAANRPEGRWARGPSIKSANTVSMTACRRWVRSAWTVVSALLAMNGWWRQTGNSSSSLFWVTDAPHDQPGGDGVRGGGERGECGLGDLGVGDQLPGVGIGEGARVGHRPPRVLRDLINRSGDRGVLGQHERELDASM